MRPISVSDLNANYEEHLERWAIELSRSTRCLKVFEALYAGRKQSKSVEEIAAESRLAEQAVRDAGHKLRGLGLCGHEPGAEGQRAFLYTRLAHVSALRGRITRLARNPSRIEKLPTKRRREPAISFEIGPIAVRLKRPGQTKRGVTEKKLRVAFLATNPDERSGLRTDIEAREVMQAIKRSSKRDEVDVKYLPAARPTDLLDAMNEFHPNVVHFSGHGGSKSLLFDDDTVEGHGGVIIDFDLVNETLRAIDTPPDVVVFNACDTLDGAEKFLDTVKVVIAMSSNILDVSASVFAARFYQALAESQSLASALKQGRVAIKMAGLGGSDLPSYLAQDGIDLSKLVLVR